MRNSLTVKVNGKLVSYEDSGKPTLPIIFVHGFPFDKSSWEPQFDFFEETRRVIIYDLPGFGLSEENAEECSIQGFADHLIQFINALSIEKAIVCGISMGGYILLNAVERYPKRFEAVILSDTNCLADSEESVQKRFATIKAIQTNGLEEFAGNYLEKVFSKEALETQKEAVAKIKKVIISNSVETLSGALKALAARQETCSGLINIKAPTLIICGEEDLVTPLALSQFLSKGIPNSELQVIPKAGHLSNLEQSKIFNNHLHYFISSILI